MQWRLGRETGWGSPSDLSPGATTSGQVVNRGQQASSAKDGRGVGEGLERVLSLLPLPLQAPPSRSPVLA